jgi:hypothetical protein
MNAFFSSCYVVLAPTAWVTTSTTTISIRTSSTIFIRAFLGLGWGLTTLIRFGGCMPRALSRCASVILWSRSITGIPITSTLALATGSARRVAASSVLSGAGFIWLWVYQSLHTLAFLIPPLLELLLGLDLMHLMLGCGCFTDCFLFGLLLEQNGR